MVESIQHKLDRVRKPRVQITYDVEIGNAFEMKELPFVVGIMADLSGMPANPLPKFKERKFVELDRDNLNDIMTSIAPRLAMRVDNKLANDGSLLNVELIFKTMDDFEPVNIVKQVAPLARLYEARVRLKDMLAKLDGNDVLDGLLQTIITNAEQRAALQKELGVGDSTGAA